MTFLAFFLSTFLSLFFRKRNVVFWAMISLVAMLFTFNNYWIERAGPEFMGKHFGASMIVSLVLIIHPVTYRVLRRNTFIWGITYVLLYYCFWALWGVYNNQPDVLSDIRTTAPLFLGYLLGIRSYEEGNQQVFKFFIFLGLVGGAFRLIEISSGMYFLSHDLSYFICVSCIIVLVTMGNSFFPLFMLLIYSILFGYSRSIWIFLLTGIVFVIFFRERLSSVMVFKKFVFIIIILLLTLIGSRTLITENRLNKLALRFKTADYQSRYVQNRFILLKTALDEFKYSPILGTGSGSRLVGFDLNYLDTNNGEFDYMEPHNLYVCILWKMGLIGFILFLLLIVLPVFKSLFFLQKQRNKIEKMGKDKQEVFFVALSVSVANLAFYLVDASFAHTEMTFLGFYFFGLLSEFLRKAKEKKLA